MKDLVTCLFIWRYTKQNTLLFLQENALGLCHLTEIWIIQSNIRYIKYRPKVAHTKRPAINNMQYSKFQ